MDARTPRSSHHSDTGIRNLKPGYNLIASVSNPVMVAKLLVTYAHLLWGRERCEFYKRRVLHPRGATNGRPLQSVPNQAWKS